MLSGDKLAFLRYTHGKTQQQIADWCDISLRYVKNIEHCEYIPSEEIYNAWLNCIYGIGEPIKRNNIQGGKGKSRKKVGADDGVV